MGGGGEPAAQGGKTGRRKTGRRKTGKQGAWFNVKTLRPELRKVLEQWNGGVRTFQQLAKTGVRTLITVLTPGC